MAKRPAFAAIPASKADVQALHKAVEALTINVRLLTRQTGDEASWPLLVGEARELGALSATAVLPNAPVTKPSG